MNRKNPKVDAFLQRTKQWQAEMQELRSILLAAPLTEELKWGKPCYTFQNHNLFAIGGFKESCALLLFQGGLLKDEHHILIKPGEETQAGRMIRFTHVREIVKLKRILKAYIAEAIAAEQAGLKVKLKKITERAIPAELQAQFAKLPRFKSAFQALTPGRQRAYLLHFSAAKQSTTRAARIEKCRPQILAGKGLKDR
ncbi:MAG TPA: YdeI/OmpD-associated family protein [Pirellulales bacterium]|jgi:uncharacterized protein YdeI (YjbR/CyaY-like superfamily)|nr:YdeI/OmpD-associated family protein [Pirellulales bacterium]